MTLFQNIVPLGAVDITDPTGTPVCSRDFWDDRNTLDAEDFILSAISSWQKGDAKILSFFWPEMS